MSITPHDKTISYLWRKETFIIGTCFKRISFFKKELTKTRPTANKEPTQEFKSTAVLPYVKGVSEVLRRCLQQQGVRTIFKSDTTLRSHLVRPKDVPEPTKQDGVVYKIPCECGKVYIAEKGRAMHERIKEHDRDIRFVLKQNSAVSEHANETGHLPIWNEIKFIDRDAHWYTRRVKEAIHIRLNPNNIKRDSGIEIPEAWIPTINSRSTTKRTYEGTTSNSRNNNEERNAPIAANQRATNSDTQTIDVIAWWRLAVLQSKRHDQQPKRFHRETNE